MLERREFRSYPKADREALWSKTWDWWVRAGFQLSNPAPYTIYGISWWSKIGMQREAWVRLDQAGETMHVDVTFAARITNEGMVGGAVAAVVFLPVAAVGGVLSYSEYEEDVRRMLWGFWSFLHTETGQPGWVTPVAYGQPTVPAPTVPAAPPAAVCAQCGAALQAGWKVCPYCGKAKPE